MTWLAGWLAAVLTVLGCLLPAAGEQLVGWDSQGCAVTMPVSTAAEVLATPEGARLARRRAGEALLALRAAREAAAVVVPVTSAPEPRQLPTGTTTTTTTVPTTLPAAGVWGPRVEQWRPLVTSYFQPADVPMAMAVLHCESRGDPGMVTPPYGASGLFQHLAGYWSERAERAGWAGWGPLDAEANVAVAAWLRYQAGSWRDWSCAEWAAGHLGGS
jgi:hypothetical protein